MSREQVVIDIASGSHERIVYAVPEDAQTVPSSISLRKCLLGMKNAGWITALEARAWARRETLPPTIDALIASLPEAQQDDAYITALTMTTVDRSNPLIELAALVFMPDASAGARAAAVEGYFIEWDAL